MTMRNLDKVVPLQRFALLSACSVFCLLSVANSFAPLPAKQVPRVRFASARGVLFKPGSEYDEEIGYGRGARYIPLDDSLEITCDPDFPCEDDQDYDSEILYSIGVPGVTPFIAFATYEYSAKLYKAVADFISSNNWVPVDGGELQFRTLAPLVNGLVVPAVALLFATLTSTTISTLRQRQVDVRRAINMEASELRSIECLLDSIQPGPVQDQCRDYLIQYTSRILAECHPRLGAGNDVINPRRGFDSELNGFTRKLNEAHGGVIPAHVADESYASVARLRETRTDRITALQSVYPALHYLILVALAAAELVAFLMETDQQLLVFLNSFQVKLLWSMMVGTFVACFTVFAELRAPFSGSYNISASVDQLHTIKLTLQASRLLSAQKKEQERKQQEKQQQEQKVNGVHQEQKVNGVHQEQKINGVHKEQKVNGVEQHHTRPEFNISESSTSFE